jgi:integrase/recombinase XerD
MVKKTATVTLYFDKRRALKDGTFPVKIALVFNRVTKMYALNFKFSIENWDKIFKGRKTNEFGDAKLELEAIKGRAIQIVQALDNFSFEAFEEIWYGKNIKALDKQNVFAFIEDRIKELIKEERIGTSQINASLLSSLKAFRKTLNFSDVTVVFLKEFEQFLLTQRKIGLSSIGIYLRELRVVVNLAIREKIMPQNTYPFAAENNGYIIPTGVGTKVALTFDELHEIKNFVPLEYKDQEDKARDFFIFSCFANGINFSDLCLLKYSNIQDNSIVFLRKKTKNKTRSKPIIIKVSITEPIQNVIDKWGNQAKYPDNYIFKELSNDMDAMEIDRRIRQFIKTTNKYIKRVQEKLNINKPLTTMVARHSFATILLRKGASKEFLKEGLGHTYITTTENYTHGFDDSEREKWANAMLE